MAEKMNFLLQRFFFQNWQQKLVAFLSAITVWFMVNKSITTTKTIPNVPIRIINLPYNKTMEGLLPTGFLREGMTLTLKGTKVALQRLEPGDVEVLLDVSGKGDEWVGDITQKNLVSLNPEVDLLHNVESVIHPEFIIKLSHLMTEKIPVRITKPIGEPPQGYQFLDIWPQTFYHSISGPERLVKSLKEKGLDLTFNLNEVRREDLDHLKSAFPGDDEIYFFVPEHWKKISVPFQQEERVEINDQNAYNLHIIFLRNEFLPLEQSIPLTVFFPFKHSAAINPDTYSLQASRLVNKKNGLYTLDLPLFARNVSRQFLEIIQDRLQISVITAPKSERESLRWSIQCVDPQAIENQYVRKLLPKDSESKALHPELHEQRLRERFRDYLRRLVLYDEQWNELKLNIKLQGDLISVESVENSG